MSAASYDIIASVLRSFYETLDRKLIEAAKRGSDLAVTPFQYENPTGTLTARIVFVDPGSPLPSYLHRATVYETGNPEAKAIVEAMERAKT